MKSPEEIVAIALKEVGQRESSKNFSPRIRQYQQATTLSPGPWPWCAAFVCWVVREWLTNGGDEYLSLKRTTPENWRPTTPLAFGFLAWAKKRPNTCLILPDSEKPLPGDLVVFDFSHIGIVEEGLRSTMRTIEGNTNGKGSREGDGVYSKERPKSLARSFIRFIPSK